MLGNGFMGVCSAGGSCVRMVSFVLCLTIDAGTSLQGSPLSDSLDNGEKRLRTGR